MSTTQISTTFPNFGCISSCKQTLLACRWYFVFWPTVDDILRFLLKHEEAVVGVPVAGVRAPYQVGMKYSLD